MCSTLSAKAVPFVPIALKQESAPLAPETCVCDTAPREPACPPLVLAANRYGQTAMHIAAKLGFMPLLAQLLEAGADISARDSYGLTPADVATIDKAVARGTILDGLART